MKTFLVKEIDNCKKSKFYKNSEYGNTCSKYRYILKVEKLLIFNSYKKCLFPPNFRFLDFN